MVTFGGKVSSESYDGGCRQVSDDSVGLPARGDHLGVWAVATVGRSNTAKFSESREDFSRTNADSHAAEAGESDFLEVQIHTGHPDRHG